jgi:hypothetical protein
MVDPLSIPDGLTRTGHFVFQVRRRDGGAWNWRLRVEAVESGACGVFESMQDALWFMRAHMVIDADVETHGEGEPDLAANEGEWLDEPLGPIEHVE